MGWEACYKASVQLKNPASAGGLGGVFELNGFSERINALYLYSDPAQTMYGIVDFGQNDVEQVLWASTFLLGGKIIADGSQLIIKNYVLGEDHLFFDESLDDEKLATFVFEGYENGYKIVENIVEHEGASFRSGNVWHGSIGVCGISQAPLLVVSQFLRGGRPFKGGPLSFGKLLSCCAFI